MKSILLCIIINKWVLEPYTILWVYASLICSGNWFQRVGTRAQKDFFPYSAVGVLGTHKVQLNSGQSSFWIISPTYTGAVPQDFVHWSVWCGSLGVVRSLLRVPVISLETQSGTGRERFLEQCMLVVQSRNRAQSSKMVHVSSPV